LFKLFLLIFTVSILNSSAFGLATLNQEAAILSAASSLRPAKRVADELSVNAGRDSFLDHQAPPAGISDYDYISVRLKTHSEGTWVTGYLEFNGSFATDVENYTNLEIPEGYLHWENAFSGAKFLSKSEIGPSAVRFSVGRKREMWSEVDSDWTLGLWQPLNRFDYLRPTEQGLTGAFLSLKSGDVEVLAFGSTLYIPEQSGPFELQNGTFSSRNPWFRQPADGMILFGKRTDVKYSMDIPTSGSVIDHGSGGFLVRKGAIDQGVYTQASFMRKPRNNLSLPFEGTMHLTNDSNYANVTVFPRVTYHDLIGFDSGYHFSHLAVSLSVLHEIVESENLPPTLNQEKLSPITFISPKVEMRALANYYWGPKLTLSLLNSIGGDTTSEGSFAGGKGVFAPRAIYRQALGLSSESLLLRMGRFRLQHGMRWIEELSEGGTILMTDFRMFFGDSWRVLLSADLLGSRQAIDQTQGFISHFRDNDRISGQLTYAF
jgi:hypothetical protein